MISDRIAEEIARSLLEPLVQMGYCNEETIQGAIKIVKLKCEQDDIEKKLEQANASVQVHTFIADSLRNLPR